MPGILSILFILSKKPVSGLGQDERDLQDGSQRKENGLSSPLIVGGDGLENPVLRWSSSFRMFVIRPKQLAAFGWGGDEQAKGCTPTGCAAAAWPKTTAISGWNMASHEGTKDTKGNGLSGPLYVGNRGLENPCSGGIA